MPESPIPRCGQHKGRFRVTFRALVQDPKTLDHIPGPMSKFDLGQHPWDDQTRDGSPILDTEQPYEGHLCVHEWAFLKGFPGKHFNYGWRFTLEPLK